MSFQPSEVLQGYRLGSRQATTELQRTDIPGVHVEFAVLRLIEDVHHGQVSSVILTGTAGDGKTYLAYRIIDELGLDRAVVQAAQPSGGYDANGIFIDLDLSAGVLTETRLRRLHVALSAPGRLAIVCANEGKLAEVEARLRDLDIPLPPSVARVNLSQRALIGTEAWAKVLAGVLEGPHWEQGAAVAPESPLAWNRSWLQDAGVAERVRRYLLLPYLLGEPITIRETLSCLAYTLTGDRPPGDEAVVLPPGDIIRFLLFNTLFSEPAGHLHGGRAAPTEKLLWWLYRFDPAQQASPEVDLQLLAELDTLDVPPPAPLLAMWRTDLLVGEHERTDTLYRQRVLRYMRYARRWYALASERGFRAYFPFRNFERYLAALVAPPDDAFAEIERFIKGLNVILSGGEVEDETILQVFHLPVDGMRQRSAVYSPEAIVDAGQLELEHDDDPNGQADATDARYLERLPRRLRLVFTPEPTVRLPISLLLYEVLVRAASPGGAFPATLWSKERDTVVRFMGALSRAVQVNRASREFIVPQSEGKAIRLTHNTRSSRLTARER